MTTDELRNKFENFKAIDDKWLFLLSLAKENKCTENIREDKWLIQGCSSKIWLKPSYVNNYLQFEVDGEILDLTLRLAKTMNYQIQDNMPWMEVEILQEAANKIAEEERKQLEKDNGKITMNRSMI